MDQFINPIFSVVLVVITWFLARRKNNAEAKTAEIDTEVKAADFYKSLLDDAKERLDEAITAIKERDIRIRQRDKKIEILIAEVEILTGEIRKYKQLNCKRE